MQKFIQIRWKKNQIEEQVTPVKLLSYNVRLFNYYEWLNDKTVPDKIFQYICKEDAGIVCLQEFLTINNSNLSLDKIKKKLAGIPYSHINYSFKISENRSLGIATFSKYPIINKGLLKFEESPNVVIFSDIKVGKDTLRVYNCHLQSTRLKKDDFHLIDSLFYGYDEAQLNKLKLLTYRLADAYKRRAVQSESLADHINSSPYSVIVCGDFNDTPVSYTYYKIRNHLKDAFLESGRGIGNTYFGNYPNFRIDYILHDKQIKSFDFKINRIKWSDHYPIYCSFYVTED
ncbi:MAG: endonuclease/exonuclease/phosphatase family protein [Bacteroidales bacterium]|nr:endonuclease/exonuclease/phosphatase family protein [Bacteroidales bacterium]